MQAIDRYFILLMEFVVFTILSFFSVDFADSLCFVFIFLSTLSLKINLELMDLCMFSIFADICAYRFIGISFIAYVTIYMITLRGRNYLRNKPNKEKFYYFLISIVLSKIIVFLFVIFFNGKFSLNTHLQQLIYSCCILGGYYMLCILWKKMHYVIYES